MEEPSPTHPWICLDCGADNPADAVWCRVCRAPLHGRKAEPRATEKGGPARVGSGVIWSRVTIVLALGLITLFVLTVDHWKAPVLVLPIVLTSLALLYTFSLALSRRNGERMSGRERFGGCFFSGTATIGALLAVGVITLLVLAILFWAVCYVSCRP